MKQWPHPVPFLTRREIDKAVRDGHWQAVRNSMVSKSTEEKLNILQKYYSYSHKTTATLGANLTEEAARRREVQVGNYINALKRGGLLNDKLEVVR